MTRTSRRGGQIESMQWDGSYQSFCELCSWVGEVSLHNPLALSCAPGRRLTVPTRYGARMMQPGEWLVRLPSSFYPAPMCFNSDTREHFTGAGSV